LQNYIFTCICITNINKKTNITAFGNDYFLLLDQIARKLVIMSEIKTEELKKMITDNIKTLKGEQSYSQLSNKSNLTAARLSDAANNKIDFRISTFIEIAIALRVHPKELLNIDFDFESYYKELDNI